MAQKNKINFITLLRFNWHQIDSRLLFHSLPLPALCADVCACVCVRGTIRLLPTNEVEARRSEAHKGEYKIYKL